jgi:hypothetical protein
MNACFCLTVQNPFADRAARLYQDRIAAVLIIDGLPDYQCNEFHTFRAPCLPLCKISAGCDKTVSASLI